MCGADFDGFTPFQRDPLMPGGVIRWDAKSSSPNALEGSEDVSQCVSIDPMSKRVRFYLKLMCGADFDGFTHKYHPTEGMVKTDLKTQIGAHKPHLKE